MARLSRSFGGFVTRARKDARAVTHVAAAVAGRGGSGGGSGSGSGSSIWLQGIARRTLLPSSASSPVQSQATHTHP